ncbi:PREDICTED: tripartite motif-containing protein 48-like [Elephantulus edwardii]|uniref:tripartite motif-containing protein 48-like n=1 Tax=Elephantulus edwardii TaxID=28737 RepID=UPI0003F06CC7|nr:PREDICTED: tripartite motif-containing protein 48-like [Elephantulus edwardii]
MNPTTTQNEFICSICRNYFIDPVTTNCGHNFCRPCLYICWEKASNSQSCLEYKKPCQRCLKANVDLKTQVFSARSTLLNSEQQMCEIHKKPKDFFCEEVKDILCLLCCNCQEPKAHQHFSIAWIAEKYCQTHLFPSSPLLTQYVKRPPVHVGLFLDYECGIVRFIVPSFVVYFHAHSITLSDLFFALAPSDQVYFMGITAIWLDHVGPPKLKQKEVGQLELE